MPEQVRQFDDSKAGTLFATDPPGGTKVKAGDKVKLLVSAGFPQLAFDDDKNIRLVNGANGDQFDPIAKGRHRARRTRPGAPTAPASRTRAAAGCS